jgi:hypothetical protein
MKVKRLAAAAVPLALAVAVAASGPARAGTVHGYPNATAYNEAVKLSHLKTVGTCAGYVRSKFPDNEPSDVSSGHTLDGKSLSLRYYVIELDSSGARIPAGKSGHPSPCSPAGPGRARRSGFLARGPLSLPSRRRSAALGLPSAWGGRQAQHRPRGRRQLGGDTAVGQFVGCARGRREPGSLGRHGRGAGLPAIDHDVLNDGASAFLHYGDVKQRGI